MIGLVVRWLLHRVIDRLTRRAADGVDAVGARPRQGAADVPRAQCRGDSSGASSGPTRWAACSRASSPAVIVSIVGFMVIAQLGYNIAPLIASAGILGVALGFGAQSLVKDFLSAASS